MFDEKEKEEGKVEEEEEEECVVRVVPVRMQNAEVLSDDAVVDDMEADYETNHEENGEEDEEDEEEDVWDIVPSDDDETKGFLDDLLDGDSDNEADIDDEDINDGTDTIVSLSCAKNMMMFGAAPD